MTARAHRASWLWPWALGVAMLSWSTAGFAEPTNPPVVPTAEVEARAKALEARLIAPCCDHQTLDVHNSGPADDMRAEIRERLARGESEDEILSAFVKQHGPEIVAVRSPGEVNKLGGTLLLLSAAGAVGAVVAIRRWRKRSDQQSARADEKKPRRGKKADAVWEQKLDAELAAMDD